MEIEVDLTLSLSCGAAALDVDDLRAVEHGHVHRVPRLVGKRLKMRRCDVAQPQRVDRGEPEVEHAWAEAVLPRGRILLEVPERRERHDEAMGRRAAQADRAGKLADTEEGLAVPERGENSEPPLERLGVAADPSDVAP